MSDPMLHPEVVADTPKPAAWRWGMYALGLGLFGVCVWFAVGEAGKGWEKVTAADPGDLGLMFAMVVASLIVNAWVFWAVIIPFRPHRPVGVFEMSMLICATSLLNYLPMRAGLIGRAAYLRQQHAIPYRLSVVMMVFVAGATAATYAWLAIVTLGLRELGGAAGLGAAWWGLVVGGLVAMSVGGWAVIRFGHPLLPRFVLRYFDDAEAALAWFARVGPAVGIGGLMAVLALRAIDVGFVAVRLWVVMRVLGEPIDGPTSVLLASGGMLATLATPLPNGLGLREAIYGGGSANPLLGLIDRAVEAIVFMITGSIALLYVHQRTAGRRPQPDDPPRPGDAGD